MNPPGARMLLGATLFATGLLVTFGALTGRLPAIIAAIVMPGDLTDKGNRGGSLVNPLVSGFSQDLFGLSGKKGVTTYYYDNQGRAYSDPGLTHRAPAGDGALQGR